MKYKKLITIDDITYLARPIKKLWLGKAEIKDYEMDFCTENGYGLQFVFGEETMTLLPKQVREGVYSKSRYSENFKPFKSGYLVGYTWKKDPRPIQTSMFDDSIRTEAGIMTMTQAWKMLQEKTQHI